MLRHQPYLHLYDGPDDDRGEPDVHGEHGEHDDRDAHGDRGEHEDCDDRGVHDVGQLHKQHVDDVHDDARGVRGDAHDDVRDVHDDARDDEGALYKQQVSCQC